MFSYIGFVMCCVVGSSVAYYRPQREAPYQTDPYSEIINSNSIQEPSQRLFWGSQGSNQVGGNGIWGHLTNKFPFLGNMFGRMELPTQYGAPNQYDVRSSQFASGRNQAQYYPQQQPQFYQQEQQVLQELPTQFGGIVPLARDVGFTDDAIIVTPPFVPPIQPAPAPVPVPSPSPVPVPVPAPSPVPVPSPDPGYGYSYNKPQIRLELPPK